MRTVFISIIYLSLRSNARILQRGNFKLRGKKPEKVALEFWNQIQKEMGYDVELVTVTCDGEEITLEEL